MRKRAHLYGRGRAREMDESGRPRADVSGGAYIFECVSRARLRSYRPATADPNSPLRANTGALGRPVSHGEFARPVSHGEFARNAETGRRPCDAALWQALIHSFAKLKSFITHRHPSTSKIVWCRYEKHINTLQSANKRRFTVRLHSCCQVLPAVPFIF